jgi:hypothetical protein
MTKKFIESYLDTNQKRPRKREFVIPDILNFTNSFIGIDTKKEYSYGMVCYTGVDLDIKTVTDRLVENQIITSTDKVINEIIELYLIDLKQYKIADILSVSYANKTFGLKLSDLKIKMKTSKIP